MLQLQTRFISDKCWSLDLSIHQRILKNVLSRFKISEGCDTENRSNDAENSALITGINYILKYIQIENSYFK